jgi:chromosome segregation ATPase
MYKVKNLSIRNLRNVKSLDVEFADSLVKISWDNGAGKSTVVDAIFLAIVGKTYIGKGRTIESLINKWESKAEIDVTLQDSGKKLKISRTIRESWSVALDIWSSEWEKLTQTDLDKLLSDFTIDPLSFTRMSKKDQFELIKKVTWVDTTEIDKEYKDKFELRTVANRAYKESKAALDEMGKVEFIEPMDTTEILKQIDDANSKNLEAERAQDLIKQLDDAIESNNKQMSDIDSQIKVLQEKRNQIELQTTEIKTRLENWKSKKWEIIDTQALKDKLGSAQEHNQKVAKFERYCELKESVQKLETRAMTLDSDVKNLSEKKEDMIKGANLPIDGMIFSEDDGIIVDGIPFDQYSSAQQMIMACRVATAMTPELKVIYIKDGSLLDSNRLQELEDFAAKNDYQIFCERVGEEVDTIILRDWEILSE